MACERTRRAVPKGKRSARGLGCRRPHRLRYPIRITRTSGSRPNEKPPGAGREVSSVGIALHPVCVAA